MDYNSITLDYWSQNETLCLEKLKDDSFLNSIPSVNTNELHHLNDKSLVRFHGMIQDMHSPEYYYETYEIVNEVTGEKSIRKGRYRDTANLNENELINYRSKENVTSERHTLVVITLPGQNEWVYNIEKEHSQILNSSNNIASSNKLLKRSLTIEETVDEQMECIETNTNKKICTKTKEPPIKSVVSKEHILNFPIPDSKGKCCLVKVYDNINDLKLNEMIEFIGFLSIDPVLNEFDHNNDDVGNKMEIQTHNPPPSLVPRIHCLRFKKLEFYNPLLKHVSIENENVMNLKCDLERLLTQLLFGDKLAAEYLICHLISSVYLRKEGLALGKFTLNISNIPTGEKCSEFGTKLYEFFQLLIPKSHYLPMTLDNMNDLSFIPKKDYDCNRLTSGLLQLSNNTHLVLDETKLQPGQLNASGCKGIQALASLIQMQKVNYDFTYYPVEFDCDIPILILSEGMSLLPSDFNLPLQPDQKSIEIFTEIIEAAKHFLKPDLLNNLRVYLTKVRHARYELSNNMIEMVQEEFVKLRQTDNTMTPEDLHQLLVLARLVCLARGQENLDAECWREACRMEMERKQRVANQPSRRQ